MQTDPRGNDLTTDSAAAADALEDMTLAFLAQSSETADRLDRTLAADPGLVIALAARGLFALLLGRREMIDPARRQLALARQSLADRGGTHREHGYVAALAALADGQYEAAVARLDQVLIAAPTDVLAARLAHALRFMLGDRIGMLTALDAVLPAWTDDLPGAGYLLGCHAFALEETGDYDSAEDAGHRALALAPDDRWGLHAVAHVHEMRDQPAAGLAWLEGHDGLCCGANNFGYHLFWHRALFHLSLGETDGALALYDRAIRCNATDDFRDIANAASLLFRLERQGVAAGPRWQELADKAEARSDDHTCAFADAHYLLALAGAGRLATARAWVDTMRNAAAGETSQARILRTVGLRLGEAILAFAEGRSCEAVERLMPLRHRLSAIGGSHAQRDVFQQLLIDAALAAGQCDAARLLIDDRLAERPGNAWGQDRARRLAALTPVV